MIELAVINRGSEAVTISSIGLRPVYSSRMPLDYARYQVDYPDRLPEGDPLPLRVKGHSVMRWIYGPNLLVGLPKDTKITGYAKAYRSFRWPWLSDEDLTERTIDVPRTEIIRGP